MDTGYCLPSGEQNYVLNNRQPVLLSCTLGEAAHRGFCGSIINATGTSVPTTRTIDWF